MFAAHNFSKDHKIDFEEFKGIFGDEIKR